MTSIPATKPAPFTQLLAAFRRSFLLWEQPFSAMFLAGLIYLLIALTVGAPWRQSPMPYHNYLADAFLHGQLNLRLIPTQTLDLSFHAGKYSLYWGPLPALLLMPFVALFGVGLSDVLQSLIVGTVNVGLLAQLLRKANLRGLIDLSPMQRALLVLFFALGTAQTPLPAVGRVWELSSLVTVAFELLAYLAAVSFEGRKAFFWAGAGVAGVLMTRISGVFVALFLVWYLLHRCWKIGWRRLANLCLVGLLPVIAAALLLAGYNLLRFGSPLDNGLNYQLSGPSFVPLAQQYGFFNTHYILPNLYFQFWAYPFSFAGGQFAVNGWGGSMFLLSPLFFAALYSLWQERRKAEPWMLLVSILLVCVPLLLNIAPGTFQFGPRYTLDFAAPLLLMTALGMRRWPTWLVSVLIFISFLHYLVGALMLAQALVRAV